MNEIGPESFRRRARRRLPRVVFDFIDGGADDEFTLAENRRAFEDLAFRPRVLAANKDRNQSVHVLGQQLALPVIIAPTGLSRVAGRGGEIAAARSAAASGTVSILSGAASISLEDVAASVEEPQWFQLYLLRDRGQSEHQIDLAKRCGFRVLVVTVDAPVSGNRERDVRNRLSIPVRVRPRMALSVVRRPRWMLDYFAGPPLIHANYGASSTGRTGSGGGTKLADHIRDMFNADQGWADLEWIRRAWDGPLVLKGVMSDIDARKAVELGCDGVIVSNHGGRQLDGLPASLDVLPEVVSAVGHQADVLIDGGFRRGTDVVKALALGAKACLIGRPWLFGLASGGEAGVRQVLETFRVEIDRTMALLGVAGCDELDHSVLRRRPGSGWERL